jgi:hypothetical protein
VIAVAGDKFAGFRAGLDDAGALGKLMPDAVDLDVQELNWSGGFSAHGIFRFSPDDPVQFFEFRLGKRQVALFPRVSLLLKATVENSTGAA